MKFSTDKFIVDLGVRYPALFDTVPKIHEAVEMIIGCYSNDGKLLVCGNGGSAADALHIVGELMKSFGKTRNLNIDLPILSQDSAYINSHLHEALPAISLVSETSLITAYSNDVAADLVFAQQVYGYGRRGDVLLAISTSGDSANVVFACEVAKARELYVIALTGNTGGRLSGFSDICINVPGTESFTIQELHVPVYHAICLAVENEFFGE